VAPVPGIGMILAFKLIGYFWDSEVHDAKTIKAHKENSIRYCKKQN
jgi:hypothetical protein